MVVNICRDVCGRYNTYISYLNIQTNMSGLNILLKYIHKDSFSRKNVKATKILNQKEQKQKTPTCL